MMKKSRLIADSETLLRPETRLMNSRDDIVNKVNKMEELFQNDSYEDDWDEFREEVSSSSKIISGLEKSINSRKSSSKCQMFQYSRNLKFPSKNSESASAKKMKIVCTVSENSLMLVNVTSTASSPNDEKYDITTEINLRGKVIIKASMHDRTHHRSNYLN
jgi:predicted HicB family RNase H-like nuclease